MRKFLAIWGREFKAAFLSPVAYVTMVALLAITGATYMAGLVRNVGSPETLTSLLFAAVILWLTLLISVISMRLFAEEKRAGTLETLMTVPVSETQVVLGKYAGAYSFLLIATAPTVGYIYVTAALGPGIAAVDAGAVLAGCLILALLSAFLLSIGLFVSLLTRNQIIAAICSFCAIWFVLLLGWLMSAFPTGLDGLVDYVSITNHVEDFARGLVDTRPIVLCASGTLTMLFISIKTLESGRWR